jgi:hypothetical protein
MPQRPSSAITLPCTSEPINDTMDTCENEKKETMTTAATKREMRRKKGVTCTRRGQRESQAYLYDRYF